uniref:Uncharacterized protein n=1 Tax=Tanacetum cinerariifolium TaxID=118510 RepID=A0A699GVG9_TANCI|nr:hypothetical protein [Tanacetum cinerariifolium]
MAASAIIISSDSSDESVGSPPSWVILFGDIPTVILFTYVIPPENSAIALVISSATPVVETTLVASLTGLCGLAFDSSDGLPLQDPYAITIAHWRSRVTARRPYHTRPNGLRRVMTARKRVGPLPACRLAWRRISPRSSYHRPSSSSSPTDSSLVHSLGLDTLDQAHSGSSTRVVSPRLGYPPVRAPRHTEAFRHWCAAPLSTFYPPTTSESSSGDSSERPLHLSLHSAGPSRKRCRSLADSVPSSTPVTRSLAPTRADHLPPRKSAGDTVEVSINPMSAPVTDEESEEPTGEDSSYSFGTRDGIVRSFEDMPIDLDDVVRDFYHHMSEVRIDRIVRIETVKDG